MDGVAATLLAWSGMRDWFTPYVVFLAPVDGVAATLWRGQASKEGCGAREPCVTGTRLRQLAHSAEHIGQGRKLRH
jgi:hypothetical protein